MEPSEMLNICKADSVTIEILIDMVLKNSFPRPSFLLGLPGIIIKNCVFDIKGRVAICIIAIFFTVRP